MAESVVSSVGQTIGKLLIDEAKFLWGVESKVEDLQRELRLIQCLLSDADARREHNRAVGECVAQLRDIAYDAEDVIERYILRAALKKGQNIIKAYACFVAKCPYLQVHVVGTEIEGFKSSISNLRMSMLAFGTQPANEGRHKRTRASMPKWNYDHFKEDFVGREDGIDELVEKLNDEKHKVVFIWGMGGLGKTSLAKKVVALDKVKKKFDGFAWTCVSQEYLVKDILVEILVKLIPDERENVMKMIDHELVKTLYTIQQKKRYIVVLDDIWTKEAWDSLQAAFPIENTRSKLLITTRNREVAEYIDPQGHFHKPRFFLHQESWDLLKKSTFPETKVVGLSSVGLGVSQDIAMGEAVEGIAKQSETEGQTPVITKGMKMLGDELLKKCGGLPLAIIVLGGLLAINDWDTTVFEKINSYFSDKSDVSKVLALSYDDLPWHLKPCFLYLGSFPEDAEIPATKVLHMWIAEGFVLLNDYDKEREIQVEDVAEQYLMELVNRGMVQVRFNLSGKIKTIHLHDLMRDFCVSKARQEKFLRNLNIQQDNETEYCSSSLAIKLKSTCKMRRLSLNMKANLISGVKSIGGPMLPLRSLMVFGSIEGKWKHFRPIFINCKFLRVLKLEKLFEMEGKLPASIGDLVHLRFLSLAGSGFEGLPQSMGNLVCMEFLDLRVSRSRTLKVPDVLWKMRRLRYLYLPFSFNVIGKLYGCRKKLRLGTLKNLRALRNFQPDNCDVKDVGKLTKLQKLTVINSKELEIVPQLAEFNLKYLQSSSFSFKSFHSITDGELSKVSSYPHTLKLSIWGKIEKLPEHKNLPQQLRKLVLLESQLEEDPMPILEKLHNLVVLMLGSKVFEGKEMVCSAGGFPQLKHLLLCFLPNLEELRVAEGAMPHLSLLGISDCPELKAIPEGVHTHDCFEYIPHEFSKHIYKLRNIRAHAQAIRAAWLFQEAAQRS